MNTLPKRTAVLIAVLCSGVGVGQVEAQQTNQSKTGVQQTEEAKSGSATKSASGNEKQKKQTKGQQTKAKPKPAPKRIVSISGGRTRLNSRHWPLLGKPDAKYIFVEMFDYTCPHCRNTHKAVSGAFKTLKDDMAILALPVPLSSACNNTVRVTNASHLEACQLAKIAIGVWRCNPAKFHKFHDWMFETSVTRTAFAARKQAEKLVGKAKLDKELSMPYASQYIAKHVEFYQRAGSGSVPKILFPRSAINGEITSSSFLVNEIKRRAK